MGIFKAYDIRGIYPEEIDADKANRIAKAIVTFLNADTIVVGRDNRLSSEELFEAAVKGVTELGVNVIDIGVVSSPMSYFAVNHLKGKGLVCVTASHNPKQYNGFKVTREEAKPVSYESGLQEMEKIYNGNQFKQFSNKTGSIRKEDVTEAYLRHLSEFVKGVAGLKVVVDCGNGVMGPIVDAMFSKLFIEYIPMYFERDGNYPNHEPNPMKEENLKGLQKRARETNANLGIAFDGDGDRVVFVDEKGITVPADFVTALIAMSILKPEDIALYDLRSSWVVKETIEAMKAKAEMSKVGHSLIKEHMRRVNAVFAGELSGHYYFKDNYYADCGMIAALMVMGLVSKKGKMSEIIKPLKKYFKIPEKNYEVEDKDAVLERVEKEYAGKDGFKIFKLDGISVETDKFWLNVRKSNTEPIIRLNAEAKSNALLQKVVQDAERLITQQSQSL